MGFGFSLPFYTSVKRETCDTGAMRGKGGTGEKGATRSSENLEPSLVSLRYPRCYNLRTLVHFL